MDGLRRGRGESQWITGPAARREMAHALRGEHDAVMAGRRDGRGATTRLLTCRIDGFRRGTPIVRVVVDSAIAYAA